MNVYGVSSLTKLQTDYGQSDSQSSQDAGDSNGGWKYLTVRANGKVYTYIVIGKNMRVLIGEATEKKTDEKDEKTGDGKKGNISNQTNGTENTSMEGSNKLDVDGQNSNGKKETIKADFLTDTSMLALTGCYQKKMREIIKDLQQGIGERSSDAIQTSTNTGKKANK